MMDRRRLGKKIPLSCAPKKATRYKLKEKGRGSRRALNRLTRMDELRSPFRRQSKPAAADFDYFKKYVAAASAALRFP
jgi:hypothetical protein